MSAPSILALRPGAKLSARDRKALQEVGIVVVQVAPEDLVSIQSVNVMQQNVMLECALRTINGSSPGLNSKEVRAEFARKLIESYLALGNVMSSFAAVNALVTSITLRALSRSSSTGGTTP